MAPTRKKRVKFAKTKSPILRKKSPKCPDSCANIVLHYLSKLKDLFQSSVVPNALVQSPQHHVSKPILKGSCYSLSPGCRKAKQKAREIVNAALQYGCANNIIEEVGNYFLFKSKSETTVSERRPTPGPEFVRCSNCKNLAKSHTSRAIAYRNDSDNESRGRSRSRSRSQGSSRTSMKNYCSKCFSKLKRKRGNAPFLY